MHFLCLLDVCVCVYIYVCVGVCVCVSVCVCVCVCVCVVLIILEMPSFLYLTINFAITCLFYCLLDLNDVCVCFLYSCVTLYSY